MTLDDARSYVRARLGVSSGESATVDALIDLMLDQEYQRLVLEYQLEVDVASLVTTADDPVVDLPNDLNAILKINQGDVTLTPVDPDTFSGLVAAGNGLDGEVAYMRNGANRIRIDPTPTTSGSDLTCWYAAAADPWDTAAEEPVALPSAFHDLPCERVVAFLALIDEATDLAALASARADALEDRLRRHLGRRGGMGPSTIFVKGH